MNNEIEITDGMIAEMKYKVVIVLRWPCQFCPFYKKYLMQGQ